jgi:hypothetical protein
MKIYTKAHEEYTKAHKERIMKKKNLTAKRHEKHEKKREIGRIPLLREAVSGFFEAPGTGLSGAPLRSGPRARLRGGGFAPWLQAPPGHAPLLSLARRKTRKAPDLYFFSFLPFFAFLFLPLCIFVVFFFSSLLRLRG